jgi:hypothetical protein
MVKDEETKKKESELINMVTEFSSLYLDDEYAEICSNLVKKLGKKKRSSF